MLTVELANCLLIDRRNLALIGCGGLRQDSDAPGQAELGMELAPQYWGRYAYAIEIRF